MGLTFWVLTLLTFLLLTWLVHRLLQAGQRANRVDWGRGWMNLLDGINRLFCYRYHRLNVLGLRLPKLGPAIVVSNHVSGLDALLLIASARRPLHFLIAREEYERPGLTWLFRAVQCIPVDRQTKPEQALRAALRSLRQGHVVALFPHGKIHLDSDPPRRIKAGAVRLSQMTDAPILPLRITGIRGEGSVIGGIIRRSRAQIQAFPAIRPDGREAKVLLEELQSILDGKLAAGE
jgi:1-acyl-sn-glycerol-3-phosphate acyltransferase